MFTIFLRSFGVVSAYSHYDPEKSEVKNSPRQLSPRRLLPRGFYHASTLFTRFFTTPLHCSRSFLPRLYQFHAVFYHAFTSSTQFFTTPLPVPRRFLQTNFLTGSYASNDGLAIFD